MKKRTFIWLKTVKDNCFKNIMLLSVLFCKSRKKCTLCRISCLDFLVYLNIRFEPLFIDDKGFFVDKYITEVYPMCIHKWIGGFRCEYTDKGMG